MQPKRKTRSLFCFKRFFISFFTSFNLFLCVCVCACVSMIQQCVFVEFAGHKCGSTDFDHKKRLRRHYIRTEKFPLLSAAKGNPWCKIDGFTTTDNRGEVHLIKYACPCCNDLQDDLNQLEAHIETAHVDFIGKKQDLSRKAMHMSLFIFFCTVTMTIATTMMITALTPKVWRTITCD